MTPDPLAAELVARLRQRGQTLATAESLTGGLIGAAVTSVPGASEVYLGGVISYATPMKATLAGVSPQTLAGCGPVAEATALELAAGVRTRTGADWAVSATGVAGPDPQDGHAPGEVWLGLAGPSGAVAERLQLSGERWQIRTAAVAAALRLLLSGLDS